MTDYKPPPGMMIDGEWAYAHDPYTQVRVLCIDRNDTYPVLSRKNGGRVNSHHSDGRHFSSESCNLVPLQKKPEEKKVCSVPLHLIKDQCGNVFARCDNRTLHHGDKIIASKDVTITEGEGMEEKV